MRSMMVLLLMVVQPDMSDDPRANCPDCRNEEAKSVCIRNLHTSAACELTTGRLTMVMIRGQLLPVRE